MENRVKGASEPSRDARYQCHADDALNDVRPQPIEHSAAGCGGGRALLALVRIYQPPPAAISHPRIPRSLNRRLPYFRLTIISSCTIQRLSRCCGLHLAARLRQSRIIPYSEKRFQDFEKSIFSSLSLFSTLCGLYLVFDGAMSCFITWLAG
jgi:hypothetical protein